MVDLDRVEDLTRMYRLFNMVPTGLPTLKRAIRGSVIRRGKEINQRASGVSTNGEVVVDVGEEDEGSKKKGKGKAGQAAQTLNLALQWVQDVLDLKDTFDRLWTAAFLSDREIESSLTEVRYIYLRVNATLSYQCTFPRKRLSKNSSIRMRSLRNSYLYSLMRI